MVEMALVLPLFLILVFGIIEFSYAFAQNNEIRHVAREAARVATVDDAPTAQSLICNDFDLINSDVVEYRISAPLELTDPQASGGTAEVELRAPYQTLTGFFDGALAGANLESLHNFFVEQATIDAGPAWPSAGWQLCP